MATKPIADMTPGAILADASVAKYIEALGIAVANAQSALDVNSIEQVAEYAKPYPGLAGKSLFQLGLTPPFYHFQTADVSVGLQLSMKVGESESLRVGLNIELDYEQSTQEDPNLRELEVIVKSSPASLTIDGVKTESKKTAVSEAAEELAQALRGKGFERALLSNERSEVSVQLDRAGKNSENPVATRNTIIFHANKSSALIRIQNLPTAAVTWTLAADKSVELPQPESGKNKLDYAKQLVAKINADLSGDFQATLINKPKDDKLAETGTLGIALFDIDKPGKTDNFTSADMKPDAQAELLRVVRIIKETEIKVDIIGFADTTAGNDHNMKLGMNRAKAVETFLTDHGVEAQYIESVTSEGEERWKDTPNNTYNQQFRRVEVRSRGSNDLFIQVEQTGSKAIQTQPTPQGLGDDNGFIWSTPAEKIDDDVKVKFTRSGGSQQTQGLSGAQVKKDGHNYDEDSPQAFAWNLSEAINSGKDTHQVKAEFFKLSDAMAAVALNDGGGKVIITAYTMAAEDIQVTAADGASISKPLARVSPGATVQPREKSKTGVMVGASVDYRTARSFEQSVTGNSSISAHLVSVPAPELFYELIKDMFMDGGD